MAQPDLNQFYPQIGTPINMGNNGFNKHIHKPRDEAVNETTCVHYIDLDTTTGDYTGKEYIQYSRTK